MVREAGVGRRLAIAAGVLGSAAFAWTAVGDPIFYDYGVNGGSGTFSVETPADPDFTGFASLLSFDLTAVLEDDESGEDVELTFALADFDSPADQPQAFFDSGAVTFLDTNGGGGTVLDGVGDEWEFALFLAENEANLNAQRVSDPDGAIFIACCGYEVSLSEGPPGALIPEPAGALTFALGLAIACSGLRRKGRAERSMRPAPRA